MRTRGYLADITGQSVCAGGMSLRRAHMEGWNPLRAVPSGLVRHSSVGCYDPLHGLIASDGLATESITGYLVRPSAAFPENCHPDRTPATRPSPKHWLFRSPTTSRPPFGGHTHTHTYTGIAFVARLRYRPVHPESSLGQPYEATRSCIYDEAR